MPTSGRRNRVNVAVHTNHHQRLRHLAAAMETTVQDILDRVLEQALIDVDNMTVKELSNWVNTCLLYTSPSPRDKRQSRMRSSA